MSPPCCEGSCPLLMGLPERESEGKLTPPLPPYPVCWPIPPNACRTLWARWFCWAFECEETPPWGEPGRELLGEF